MIRRHPYTVPTGPGFPKAVRLTIALHELFVAGRPDSPEADAIRDALDGPWANATPAERDILSGLSADLYSVSDPEPWPPPPGVWEFLFDADREKQNGNWARGLERVREDADRLPPAAVSYMRGSFWFDSGIYEPAAVFFEHAAALAPSEVKYQFLSIEVLSYVGSARAVDRVEAVIAARDSHHPAVVIAAAAAAFAWHSRQPGPLSQIVRILAVLDWAMPRLKAEEWTPVYLIGLFLTGTCQEILGNLAAAVVSYTRGLAIDPAHDGFLTARGTATYGKSPRAIADFTRAVDLKTQLVWPYFFLAHHHLLAGRFDDCRRAAERGLLCEASNAVRGQLYEWLALAQAELGFPAGIVTDAFEQAVRLAPQNASARRNFDRYLSRVGPESRGWDKPSAAEVVAYYEPADSGRVSAGGSLLSHLSLAGSV